MLRIFIILMMLPLSVFAEELAKGEKDTIFIGEIKVADSVTELAAKQNHAADLKNVVDKLGAQFTNSLNTTRVFDLVDRKRIADLDKEQKFAAAAVDPNDKNMAQGAKMAGAKFAFLPEISAFEDKTTSKTKNYSFIGESVTTTRRSIYLSVQVQIVNTTSGKLLPDSPSVQVDTSMLPADATGEKLYVELATLAAKKLAQNTVSLLRPPKVLDVTGNQIMINRGIESGFPVDTTIEIYAVKEVKDEDTGETFRNELPVGKAKIVRGDAKQSFALIIGDNLGIAAGCVARPLKVKPDVKPEAKSDVKKAAVAKPKKEHTSSSSASPTPKAEEHDF